jgi:hypothetical protein
MAGVPFDPAAAIPGQVLTGIDPASLRAGQQTVLDANRLEVQRDLIRRGIRRYTPIEVTSEGIIADGHHGCRAAAEAGKPVEILIVLYELEAGPPIVDLPVIKRS